MTTMQITYRFRVKDKHGRRLAQQGIAVNVVWNYCNEIQRKAFKESRHFLSGYDLWKLVAGATREGLNLHSHSAMRVCLQYARSRRQHRKVWLRWRGRKSLGWVPFNTGHVAFRDGAFVFRGSRYDVWLHRRLPTGATLGAGSFSQDARGRWYLNIPVEITCATKHPGGEVGVDLGLHSLATYSDGRQIATRSFYRVSEQQLGVAQRATKKRRLKALHAKIANQRKDGLHKASADLTKRYALIVVGDVSPSKMARTKMAKSVLDAGWANFKYMLSYKALRHGGTMVEVSEVFTTRTCSSCGALSGPQGMNGLRIREWTCVECGVFHDRDVNAARNILRLGQQTLVEGAAA